MGSTHAHGTVRDLEYTRSAQLTRSGSLPFGGSHDGFYHVIAMRSCLIYGASNKPPRCDRKVAPLEETVVLSGFRDNTWNLTGRERRAADGWQTALAASTLYYAPCHIGGQREVHFRKCQETGYDKWN